MGETGYIHVGGREEGSEKTNGDKGRLKEGTGDRGER
jgi:hypothetical protein